MSVVRRKQERATLKKTKKAKNREYREGADATRAFEQTMKALFHVPKSVSKKPKKGKD